MTRAALGIGQVGLGSITVPHREGYRIYDQPVVAGFDPDPAARRRFAEDTPGATVHESLDALLADPAVGVVDLAVPHHRATRLPVVEAVAAAGRPMLIQKPLASTYADALELVRVIEDAGVPAMVNQNMAFVPTAINLVDALMRDRVVGEPRFLQVTASYRFDTDHHPWFGKDERWWTGALTVHHLGLLQVLLGPPERVYALTGHDPIQPGVTSDGYGHLALSYPGGAQALVVSTGTYYGVDPVPHGNEKLWVQGERGLVDWRPEGDLVISRRVPGSGDIDREVREPASRGRWFPHAFGLAMAHFRQAVAAGAEPLCSVADNLHVMAVIEAAYRSGAEGRAVRLEEIMGERYSADYGTGWSHGYDGWIPPMASDLRRSA